MPIDLLETSTPNLFTAPSLFDNAISDAGLTTYQKALRASFAYLHDIARKNELFTLLGLLTNNEGIEDKAAKAQSYLATNFNFASYRYSWHIDESLHEHDITTQLQPADAFKMLQVISIFITSREKLTTESEQYIQQGLQLQQQIDQQKHSKSLAQIAKEHPEIKYDRIRDIYKGKYQFTRRSEIKKIMLAKLYLLTFNHDRFTYSEKHNRVFNTFTQITKVYRNHEFCFQLNEFDIRSANPQIIDLLFSFNRYSHVYANLMKAHKIDRDAAKVLFNSTLNNYRLTRSQAVKIYLEAGYSEDEAGQIADVTAETKKGSFYKMMAKKESEIINRFIGVNFNHSNVIRLHDAIYYYPEFTALNKPETNGIEYGETLTPKQNIPLDLKMNVNYYVFTAAGLTDQHTEHVLKQTIHINGEPKVIHEDKHITFLDREIRVLNANFNINAPIFIKGKMHTPTDQQFLQRIDQLYTSLLYLQEDERLYLYVGKAKAKRMHIAKTNAIFNLCIDKILSHAGISLNKAYIMAHIQQNEYDSIDAFEYFEDKAYTYKGKPLSRGEFQKMLHKERAGLKKKIDNKVLIQKITELKKALHNDQLIHISKGEFKRSKATFTAKYIDQINELIGIKTKANKDRFNTLLHQFAHPIYNTLLGYAKHRKTLSVNDLSKQLNTRHSFTKQIVNVLDRKEYIMNKLQDAIQNLQLYNSMQKQKDIDECFIQPDQLFAQPQMQQQKQIQPATPTAYQYNSTQRQADLHQWDKQPDTTKKIYNKNYTNGFLAWLEDQHEYERRYQQQ